jgi:hypothetical protein
MGELVCEWRTDKNGVTKRKWVRPEGVVPPANELSYRRSYVESVRRKCIVFLGMMCVKCGYDKDIRALQIDHVNGDSKEDKKKTGGSYYHNIWKQISTGKYQVLCANCNKIKAAENHEYPRKELCMKG